MKKLILMVMLIAPTTLFAQKFGHVDSQSIMQSLPEISKIRGELEAKAKEYENELQAMQTELTRKAEEYEKQKSTMSATKQQETEANLQEMYQKIQQQYQANQQELQKLENEKMAPVFTKVRNAIQNVGKNGNYTYIFEAGAPLYVGTASKDLTQEIQTEIKKLK